MKQTLVKALIPAVRAILITMLITGLTAALNYLQDLTDEASKRK